MAATEDLTGRKFGRLTVIEKYTAKKQKSTHWVCICDCGTNRIVRHDALTSGNTMSCGCYQKERTAEIHTTHGGFYDRLHGVWNGMLQRCRNPKSAKYKHYGGRGIKVCDEWLDYVNFKNWALSTGYDEEAKYGDCTIDRINVNGDYCPENCRWVNAKTQANNQRRHLSKHTQSVV